MLSIDHEYILAYSKSDLFSLKGVQKDISKAILRKDVGLSTGTMSKLNKGEEVALSVLMRICNYLDCDIGDICEIVRDK